MKGQNLFVIGVSLLVLATLGMGLLNQEEGSEESIEFESSNSSEVKFTDSGTKYIVHPSELRQGCPGMDCIPSIDNPKYEEVDEAEWMNPGDEVLSVEVDGEARAYPLRIMDSHEIVNTEINGEPISITYCPLCRSGVAFSRKVNGDVLEFGVSGKLREANLVMYDRQTETYWSQIGGRAIIGPRVPQRLDIVYSSIGEWREWKEEHPEGKVLSRDSGNRRYSYDSRGYLDRGYDNPQGYGASNIDDRLDETKLVHGIKVGNTSKAYPDDIVRQEDLIQDEVNGKPVMILEKPDGTIAAFSRKLGDTVYDFKLEGGSLVSSNGMKFDMSGDQANGDKELERIIPSGFYWFAWSKFNPDTQVYRQG